MDCTKSHRYEEKFQDLPDNQGGPGRHKCAGCAYEFGYQAGHNRANKISIDLNSLPSSQAGSVRHKSPHAAFALGYLDGVLASYS